MLKPLLPCVGVLSLLLGCSSTPTPLSPLIRGSVGVPHDGVLTHGMPLKRKGAGYRLYRKNGRHYGNPRLVRAIEHAALAVQKARPKSPALLVGDLSQRFGGQLQGHRSHRSGRDVDLLLYALTPDGRPVESPGFIRFGADGLGHTDENKFYRIDVERLWILTKAFVESPEANVQWMFIARWLEALIIEYARAKQEDPELIWHAESVLLQPGDSAAHDDHIHLRIACTPEESVEGCLGGGPYWTWISPLPQLKSPPDPELFEALLGDLPTGAAPKENAQQLTP